MSKPYKIAEEVIHKVSDIDMNYGNYTYNDYLKWQFEEMVEIIRGRVFMMSPAPRTNHQRISMKLSGNFYNMFKNKPCQVFAAPFDVRFPNTDGKILSVVQPDLCVICDNAKIDDRGCLGAPDLIVEILSPSTSSKDQKLKYMLYEEFGVKEYWMIYPTEQSVHVFVLNNCKYEHHGIFTKDDMLQSPFFPTLQVNLGEIFEEIKY